MDVKHAIAGLVLGLLVILAGAIWKNHHDAGGSFSLGDYELISQ